MKTNARKILSLILSFLMVFGSVATLLPTTVMAAETDATNDGSTIDCVIYSAADIYFANATCIPKTKITYPDAAEESGFKTMDVTQIGYGNAKIGGLSPEKYVRFVPSNLQGANDGCVLVSTATATDDSGFATSGIKYSEYPYFAIVYKTNITANNLNVTLSTTAGTYTKNENKIFLNNAMGATRVSDGTLTKKVVKISNTYKDSQEIIGMFFKLYGTSGQKQLEASDYFDIQYIGFFQSEEDASKFEYDTYIEKTITVTNEDGSEVLNKIENTHLLDEVTLLESTDLPYTNAKGHILALVDQYGEAYSIGESITVAKDLDVKLKYIDFELYLPEDLTDCYNSDRTSNLGEPPPIVNGYYRLANSYSNVGSNVVGWYFDIDVGYRTAIIEYVTNTSRTNNPGSFVRHHNNGVKGPSIAYYYTSSIPETVTDGSVTENIRAYYPLDGSKSYAAFDFAPWCGAQFSATSGVNNENRSKAYADIEYVALFKVKSAEKVFDYDAYKNSLANDLYVTLEALGEEISTEHVKKGEKFTVPAYEGELEEGDEFGGWKAADGTIYEAGAEITVNENLTLTAFIIGPVTVTIKGLDGAEDKVKTITSGTTVKLDASVQNGKDLYEIVYTLEGTDNEYKGSFVADEDATLIPRKVPVTYHILSADKGNLETNYVNNTTWNNKESAAVKTEGDKSFAHWVPLEGKTTTAAGTQIQIDNVSDNAGASVLYSKTPFVSYRYRTNIEAPDNKWTGSFAQANYSSVKWSQTVEGIVSDGEWHTVVKKPDAFGGKDVGLVAFRIAPYNAKDGIVIDADRYIDIEYIGFFPSAELANAFDYEEYLNAPSIVTVKDADGNVITTLKTDSNKEVTLPEYEKAVDANQMFVGWKVEGTNNTTAVPEGTVVATKLDVTYVPAIAETIELTLYVYGDTEPVQITGAREFAIPVDGITTQYVEDGQLMVISAWEIDGDEYPVDSYAVTEPVTATAVYAPAYILSEADGTLVGKPYNTNTATVNNAVASEENGVYYEHYTSIAGKTTVPQSQVEFTDSSKTKLYAEVPYVAYSYRTNIEAPDNTWYTAYTVHNWDPVPMEDNPSTSDVETTYYGTANFTQKVQGIVSDGDWHVAIHKPSGFGNYPNEDRYADASMYYTGSRLGPWKNTADIALTGNEYIDVEYIGFFPSETAARNFDYDEYLAPMMVDVTVMIDNAKNDALSGKYVPGSSIKLPENNNPLFVGYVQNGKVVTTVTAEEGTISVTTLYRHDVEGDYVNERGNLANLKDKEDLTVVYLGGSVTAGSGASSNATKWTGRTTQYLKDMGYNVTAFNEGVGGTGSRLGSFRVDKDVIAHNPDLVFIDFAMNDEYCGEVVNGVYNGKYYEYIVREIRKALPNTEIIAVYIAESNRVKKEGLYLGLDAAASAIEEIAEHYDVTSIDVGKYAAEAIFGADGTYSEDLWSPYFINSKGEVDDVHPNDYGYALYAEVIASYLAGIETTEDIAAKYELPEDAVYEKALVYAPEVIDFADVEYSEDEWTITDKKWSTTFDKHLAPIDYTAKSQTVSFKFTGTELAIYYSSPSNADSTIAVTVDGKTKEVGGRASTNGPKVFFEGLDNVEHDVTVIQSNVKGNGYIIGILAGGVDDRPEYTINLTASIGGQVKYDGVTDDSFVITAKEGDKLVFTAVPEEGNYLRNWHDLTYGQMTPLTDADGNTYANGEAPETITYKVVGDAFINANFVPDDIKPKVRFVAFTEDITKGYFNVGESNDKYNYFDEYVSIDENVALTAIGIGDYAPVAWIRFTQDSETEVLVDIGATISVPAVGASIFYQPVFAEEAKTVYVDKATGEILSWTAQPGGYAVDSVKTGEKITVNYCTKDKDAGEKNILEVYAYGDTKPITADRNPAYGSEWIITTSRTDTKWVMSLDDGKSYFDASYDKEFHFNYMFADETKVIIKEVQRGEEEASVKTLASWVEDGKTRFTGIFVLPENYTLLSHGVLMAEGADGLAKLESVTVEGNEIKVDEGVIVGHIRENENATVLFTVSKKHSTEGTNDWYGKAFLVYKDAGGNEHTVFGDAISATPAV